MGYKELITSPGIPVSALIGKSLSEEYEQLCQTKINPEIKEINKDYARAHENAKHVWLG